MTSQGTVLADDRVDDHVNDEIRACLTAARPQSFFLFAGAGSGKTRALVTALKRLRDKNGQRMRLHGQQVGVITYTNAACDEIKGRLDFDVLFSVSTIHSFVWQLIQGFDSDIRSWLRANLASEIGELQAQLQKGRRSTKTAADRERSIVAKQKRLHGLDTIKRFIYSPTGDNRTRDALNHSEIIKIGADFLTGKPLMQSLLISRFPILLIDESQDTDRLLMEAFLSVQHTHSERFAVGLFGDMMQRIYADGKVDLGRNLPPDWAKPALKMNHRCPRRIIRLINKIRSTVDDHSQSARTDASDGVVRLFVAQSGDNNKHAIESRVKARMAEITGDSQWSQLDEVKTLILEHHMAAKRMGFFEMFEPLYRVEEYRTGLLDGSLPLLRFFASLVHPLVTAKRSGNEYAAASIVRKESPLLSKKVLEAAGANQLSQVESAKSAVDRLMAVVANPAGSRFLDVLQSIAQTHLFDIPDTLRPFLSEESQESTADHGDTDGVTVPGERESENLEAVRSFLTTPFAQVEPYAAYVMEDAPFDTHQGVKGLEFPRVFVVIDDEEARGFMFSYEKLFGAKELTSTDLKNEREGAETGIDRTRRLFYVTCSRAKNSLALLAFSANPSKVGEYATGQGWFEQREIEYVS